MPNDNLKLIEHTLKQADVACQLWPHDVENIGADIDNTFGYLQVSQEMRQELAAAEVCIKRYAVSRCCNDFRIFGSPRNEALRTAAWAALETIQHLATNALPNARARNLGMA